MLDRYSNQTFSGLRARWPDVQVRTVCKWKRDCCLGVIIDFYSFILYILTDSLFGC